MSCSSCVKHINAVLRPIAGVNEVTVDLPSDQVTVRGDTAAPC
ncbi:heavy-metal-associated domain-containing protein [Pseudomonas turukhanskensis]|nr:heavy metal-associated domain-containing protein [Pseudomonas turukhanskensis]